METVDIYNILLSFELWRFAAACVALYFLPSVLKMCWERYVLWSHPGDKAFEKPLPPGTLGYPFIGETVPFILKMADYYHERTAKYGRIYKTHLMGKPTIRICGAENIRRILTSENTLVTSQWPESIQIVLGEGALSMMHGEKHYHRKHVIAQAFSQNSLECYIPHFQSIIRKHLEEWRTLEHIIGFDAATDLSVYIAAKVIVGFDFGDAEIKKIGNVVKKMMYNAFALPINIPGSGLNKALKCKQHIVNEAKRCIKSIEEKGSDINFPTTLNFIMRADPCEDESSRDELAESVMELLFTGHDTTSSALCSAMMFLGLNKHVIQKLRDELQNNDLLDSDDDANDLNLKTVNSLTYLHCVTKEILRLAPPVGAGYRKVLKTFELEGYQIPEGWTLAVGIRDSHHNAPVFEESLVFNPDRWLNENANLEKSAVDKFYYTPFGYGGRVCVGREFAKLQIKVFIIELCRSCDWDLVNPDVIMKYIPVPRAKDKLPVKIRARDS